MKNSNMDGTKVFANLKELGHVNSRREELREFVILKIDQILKFLSRRIITSDGADVLDCIFNGLTDTPSSIKIKVKVVDIVLESMRKVSTSLTHCSDVISRLRLELPRMPINDLVRWSNDSVQSIVADTDVNMIWNDILPECHSSLCSHVHIKHCGTEMSPAEYKEQCVRTLCQCNWNERQLVQLAAMFQDIQLNRTDHTQVVNKICSNIIDVPPETLPPLVHQLLKLCKSYDVDIVLAHLSLYFNKRLYSKLEPAPSDSESTTMDIDEIAAYSSSDVSRCLSTCVYHTTQGAAQPELIRKHLRLWPRTQLVRSPFLLDVALALSAKGADFRTACLDIIRQAIEQRVLDDQKSQESAWVRSVLPPDVDIASVLKVLTSESTNHHQLTSLGLINLAFSLLLSRNKPVQLSRSLCSLAEVILVRVAKSQPETASHIVSQLSDRLMGDVTAQRQYADCLYILCKLSPVSLSRCPTLPGLLECASSLAGGSGGAGWRGGARVLAAARPLLQTSTRVRDTLLVACRKGLYSRDSAHRCLALSGFLTVLRHLKLSRGGGSGGSQSLCSEQFSAHSYLTQLSADFHTTQAGAGTSARVRNEAMCMEVVSIIQRCLLQDAAVKQLLYSQLFECAKEKAVLHESILEFLHSHLDKYLSDADGSLVFNSCVNMTPLTANLTEPLGHLLYCIAQFLQPSADEELEDILTSQNETGSAHLRAQLSNVMLKIDWPAIDMDDPGLSDLTAESKAKALKVQQMLHCYEALIAHHIMQWTTSSENVAETVYDLFKNYNQLLEKTKTPSKLSKKASKALNDTRATNKSQKSQKSQKETNKGKPVKASSVVKDRAGPFKPLPCLWDLRFCLRVLELLYSEEVSWSSLEKRNSIRGRRDFHQFVLRAVQSVLTTEHLDRTMVGHYVVKIAAVLYSRCVSRFRDVCDFDEPTAIYCLDIFNDCLTLLFSPDNNFKLDALLPNITGLTENGASASVAAILERIHASLLDVDAEDASERRVVASLSRVATTLLEESRGPGCARLTNIIIQLEDLARHSKVDCLALIPALLAASCREQQDAPLLDDLLARLTHALGKIDEEDTSIVQPTELFPYVDSASGHAALAHACGHVTARCRLAERCLGRAKDLKRYRPNDQRAALLSLYKALIVQLCQLTTWTARLTQLRCTVGAGSDRVLVLCCALYSLLEAFVKEVDHDMIQDIRLDRLLKLSGRKLSAATDALITYLHESTAGAGAGAAGAAGAARRVPRLVLHAERFCRQVLLLPAQHRFQQYLSLGTARDFRIRAPILQEVLQGLDAHDKTGDDDDEEPCINDADTALVSPEPSDKEEDETPAQPKRRKKS